MLLGVRVDGSSRLSPLGMECYVYRYSTALLKLHASMSLSWYLPCLRLAVFGFPTNEML